MNHAVVNHANHPPTASNPFSAKQIRPGATAFLFSSDKCHDLQRLVEQLARQRWWGEIVGPHGSGKSSLLATLIPAIEAAGHWVQTVELHDGQRRLPPGAMAIPDSADFRPILIIDGYEQLGWLARHRVKRFCRRRAIGLLVTSHRCVGLPPLHEMSVDLALAQRIVEHLQAEHPKLVSAADVAPVYARHTSDLREMLFELYDLYESRRRSQQ